MTTWISISFHLIFKRWYNNKFVQLIWIFYISYVHELKRKVNNVIDYTNWSLLRACFKHKRTIVKIISLIIMIVEAVVVLIRQTKNQSKKGGNNCEQLYLIDLPVLRSSVHCFLKGLFTNFICGVQGTLSSSGIRFTLSLFPSMWPLRSILWCNGSIQPRC